MRTIYWLLQDRKSKEVEKAVLAPYWLRTLVPTQEEAHPSPYLSAPHWAPLAAPRTAPANLAQQHLSLTHSSLTHTVASRGVRFSRQSSYLTPQNSQGYQVKVLCELW